MKYSKAEEVRQENKAKSEAILQSHKFKVFTPRASVFEQPENLIGSANPNFRKNNLQMKRESVDIRGRSCDGEHSFFMHFNKMPNQDRFCHERWPAACGLVITIICFDQRVR